MIWCYRFDDYLLEYILSQSSHQISPELLVSSRLDALINYDRENKTELYRTLQVYLEHERNSLQTAKTLFIHRSSLVYRLERIQKITKIDLDNPRHRLLLQICFRRKSQHLTDADSSLYLYFKIRANPLSERFIAAGFLAIQTSICILNR